MRLYSSCGVAERSLVCVCRCEKTLCAAAASSEFPLVDDSPVMGCEAAAAAVALGLACCCPGPEKSLAPAPSSERAAGIVNNVGTVRTGSAAIGVCCM